MSMPLSFATKVSFASMRKRWIRTLLALFPCVLLIAVMFVGSTIPNGVVNEMDKKVLQNAESSQEIVQLDPYYFIQNNFSGSGGDMSSNSSFDQKKYDVATKAPQVQDVYPQLGFLNIIPDSLGNTTKPFLGVAGNSAEFAKLYTGESFVYKKGEPIPIIINPKAISSAQYNWGDKKSIDINYNEAESVKKSIDNQQLKDADALMGSVITANLNDFGVLPEAFEETNSDGSSVKITKLTKRDEKTLDKKIAEVYSPYWKINELKKPLTTKFKVVGLIKGQSSYQGQAFIPNEAVIDLINTQFVNQKKARTTKALDNEFLANEQSKIEIKKEIIDFSNANSFGVSNTWQKDPESSVSDVAIVTGVSGLIVEPTKNKKGKVEYKETTLGKLTEKNFQPSGAMVRLDSADSRQSYIEYLKTKGIEIYDESPLSIIKSFRKGTQLAVTWLTIILGSVVALVLLTTMGRFVADSKREIGVWRAIGATRFDIKKLVLTRMAILLLIGVGVGLLIGFIASYVLSGMLASQFNQATNNYDPYATTSFAATLIISFLGGEVPQLNQMALLATDWGLLLSRLGILTLITLVFGLLPARRASRISPVTAIRESE